MSLSGLQYRIDIYDEGFNGTPVTLLGGPQPFVTNEDSSDDFFAPVRTQTGTIQVCTAIPGGGMLRLDDILPANNIARPVRLMRGTTVEWQGFLSCEAYSQQYTSVPQILDLPVISVLEAMASVQLDQTRSTGFTTINAAMYNALNEIAVQCGMTCFTHINYSQTDKQIFTKYIDQTVLFKLKEYCNDTGVTYAIEGLSTKDALSRICAFMGWTAREQGTQLYLERHGEQFGMRRDTLSNFNSSFDTNATNAALVTQNMSALTWRGADHKRSISQGAKSVQVAAKVDDYQLGVAVSSTPKTSLAENPAARSLAGWGWVNANTIRDYYSNVDMRSLYIRYIVPQNIYDDNVDLTIINSAAALNYANTVSWVAVAWYTNFDDIINDHAPGTYYDYATAFLCMLYVNGRESDHKEGLLVFGTPIHLYYDQQGYYIDVDQYGIEQANYIYKQRSMLNFRASEGFVRLNIQMSAYVTSTGIRTSIEHPASMGLTIAIQFGNQWARKNGNTYSWGSTFATILLPIDSDGKGPQNYDGSTEEKDGLFIPITSDMSGEVTLYIYNEVDGYFRPTVQTVGNITGFFISSLDIDYTPLKDSLRVGSGENKYFRMLGTNFRDEIVVNCDLATSVNNNPSPSLVMDSASEQTTYLDYKTGASTTEARRPEKDLIDRLAAYYGASRQRVELEVAHPTTALPLLKLNGINDGKKYLPLAESRDWAEDKSTLTCFETVNS